MTAECPQQQGPEGVTPIEDTKHAWTSRAWLLQHIASLAAAMARQVSPAPVDARRISLHSCEVGGAVRIIHQVHQRASRAAQERGGGSGVR
jgi:hypothetical protein